MTIPLRWVGAISDCSGYSSATRGWLRALLERKELDMSVQAVSFEQQHTTHGSFSSLVQPYLDRDIDYKIKVVHLTPENYPLFRKADKYNIACTAWETERVPKSWVELCNMMNEVWVPSSWNKEVFINSGVIKPIIVIPHTIEEPDLFGAKVVDMGVDNDTYIFYSIFQWIARKAPEILLKAYLTEFLPYENVCLALKTYRLNASGGEQSIIKQDIQNIKKSLAITDYPPIRFFGTFLSSDYMKGFYQRGDCLISAHRAEGFALTCAEAMILGKPVIATNYSGNLEFMNKYNSFLINYQRTPVCNMLFPNYDGSMVWADPDIMHLRKLMRFVFENREVAKDRGLAGQATIRQMLNPRKIGDLIIQRLAQITEAIQ